MKCKIENKGSALLLSCFGLSQVDPQELEYKYLVKLPDQDLATLQEKVPVWPGVTGVDEYRPLLSCVQGKDSDDLLFKALYHVFSIISAEAPNTDSFKSALLRVADKIDASDPLKGRTQNIQVSLGDLDAKLAASAGGVIDGLNRVSKVAARNPVIGVSIVGDHVRVTGENASFDLSFKEALAVTYTMNHRNDPRQEPREIDSLSSLVKV